jgi:hypothetical protein
MVCRPVHSLCVGSFWGTEMRRRLSDFSASVAITQFFIVAKRTDTDSTDLNLMKLLRRPFVPFDLGMWTGLLLALLYAAAPSSFPF